MHEVSLSELLRRHRGARSLREMARQSGMSVMSIKALEDGITALPGREWLPSLCRAYGIAADQLALAAYGVLAEDVPEALDPTS